MILKPLHLKILRALADCSATRATLRAECGCTMRGLIQAEQRLLDEGYAERDSVNGSYRVRITELGLALIDEGRA